MAEFTRAIQQQDTVVTVSDTSRIQGGSVGDTLNIDTVIKLTSPEAETVTLVLPTITGDPQKAYLRTIGEVDNRQEFESPIDLEQFDAMTDEQRKKLEEQINALKQQWDLIKEEANQVALSTIDLVAGSQELKFFMQKEIIPSTTPEGEIFEFSFIAPQSNFSVTQGQFNMSVIIILPRGATIYGEPLAISPEGIPAPVLEYNSKIAGVGRHVIQYSMQYDPIFTIRYKY